MSENIVENSVFTVTRFAGGTGSRAGRRVRGRCYQIAENGSLDWIELTAPEALRLAFALVKDQAAEFFRLLSDAAEGTVDLDSSQLEEAVRTLGKVEKLLDEGTTATK